MAPRTRRKADEPADTAVADRSAGSVANRDPALLKRIHEVMVLTRAV
jgi:hypothetical protein